MGIPGWKPIPAIERPFREARGIGGDLAACKVGCDAHRGRPFAITEMDAARLGRGGGFNYC